MLDSLLCLWLAFSPSVSGQAVGATPVIRTLPGDDDVGRIYEDLQSMTLQERRLAIGQMRASQKAAVWAHHFLTYLSMHPELTPEQKAVIQDVLSLITPQFFSIDESCPDFPDRVQKPLQEITERAQKLFPRQVALDLFVHLGPEHAKGLRPRSESLHPAPNMAYCECSTISDWCAFNTGLAGMKCTGGGCFWSSTGCGTLLAHSCTGICVYSDPGGGGG